MLNNLFKRPTFVRMEQGDYNRHIATIKSEAKVLADMRVQAIETERDKAIAERDAVFDEHTLSVDRELKAVALLHRALVQLEKVDPSRTGGKQLRDAREKLFADAMLAGLWGELPTKE